MRPVAVYSALRLGLFFVALLVLRVLGVGGLLSVVIAVVLAMLLSFLVLRRQRDAVTRALMERRAAASGPPVTPAPRRARSRWSFGGRLADDAAAEDAAVDDAAGGRRSTRPDGPAGGPR